MMAQRQSKCETQQSTPDQVSPIVIMQLHQIHVYMQAMSSSIHPQNPTSLKKQNPNRNLQV
jgi:hypothetical protein